MTDAAGGWTKGPWNVRDHKTSSRHIWVEGGPAIGLTAAGPYKRQILEDEDYPEKRRDADLVAEAGTVATETGLSPRQLAERLTNAEKALTQIETVCIDNAATGHSNSWGHGMALDFVCQVARAALDRTTRMPAKGEG